MTTSSRTSPATRASGARGRASFWSRVLAGLVGGVAGGLVFGMLMAVMGMLPTVAMMVGSDVAAVGFGIHMMISIGIGLGLTVLFGNLLLTTYVRGLLVGMVYGAIWWVLGPLVIMPLMMGMPLFTIDTTALFSFMGHIVYGGILGVVAVAILSRRR